MAYDDLDSGAATDRGLGASPRSVMAFFDTDDAAKRARDDLVQAGVPSENVRLAGGESTMVEPAHPHGFWETLKDFFMPDEDRHLYAEGLRRGGFAVSVSTDSAAYDHVIDILDRDGAVDMEERSAGWREEGWDGTPAAGFTGSLSQDERAYEPAGSGTAGFAASRADQPLFDGPVDTAAIEPGLVTPEDPEAYRRAGAMTPDKAYAAAAPGIATPADPGFAPSAIPEMDSSKLGPYPLKGSPEDLTPIRDTSHGRPRVRSYIGDKRDDGGSPS